VDCARHSNLDPKRAIVLTPCAPAIHRYAQWQFRHMALAAFSVSDQNLLLSKVPKVTLRLIEKFIWALCMASLEE
jgi:hypothetical protein